jgi:hypothetical protein
MVPSMDQRMQIVLMFLMMLLLVFCGLKLTFNRFKQPQKGTGIIILKSVSRADEYSVSKGYFDNKELHSIKIKCDTGEKTFSVSDAMYSMLEVDQKIYFRHKGGALYDYEII